MASGPKRRGPASTVAKGVLAGALAVLSEAGLVWLAFVLALDGRTGWAWLAGAGAAVLLVPLVGLVIRHNAMDDHERPLVVAGVVLSGVLLGWLALHLMTGGAPQRAGLVALPAAALFAVTFWLGVQDDLDGRPGWVLALVFTVPLALVVATLAREGRVLAAWLVGGPGLAGTLGALWVVNDWSVPRVRLSVPRRALPEPSGPPPPGAVVPLWAQAAGLVVPLGSLGWAALHSTQHRPGTGPAAVLVGAGELAVAAAVLGVLQALLLGWLRPGCTPGIAEKAAAYLWRHAVAHHDDDPSGRTPRGREARWLEEREWALRDVVRRAGWDGYGRERADREGDRVRARRIEAAARTEFGHDRAAVRTSGLLVRPLRPAAGDAAVVEAAFATGLAVDRVWPRIELVAPPRVRHEARRLGRAVALLRVTAAGAVCTAAAWGFAAEVLVRPRPESGSLVVLVLGPLLIALAAVVAGRRRVVAAYEHRADAADVYRFDLAEALRLPLPDNHADFLGQSAALLGVGEYDRPLARTGAVRTAAPGPPENAGSVGMSGADREALVSEVSAEVVRGVRAALRDEHEAPARRVGPGQLGATDLARLAEEVARRTSAAVGQRLGRELSDLHRNAARELQQVLRAGIEEAVTGPPLANFTGYFALQLDAGQEVVGGGAAGGGASGGLAQGATIVASPGQRLGLVLFVVRDPRGRDAGSAQQIAPERQFFVLEPVHIEGGRDVSEAEFDALVDSPTLAPSPHRRTLRTEREAQTVFRIPLPEEEGLHEVWFQLYQAGRLVQVIAVSIAVRAAASEARSGGDVRGQDSG